MGFDLDKDLEEFTKIRNDFWELYEKHNLKKDHLKRESLLLTMLVSPVINNEFLTDEEKYDELAELCARLMSSVMAKVKIDKALDKFKEENR